MTITLDQLNLIMPGGPTAVWIEPLRIAMQRYKIETGSQQAMFLSQVAHESDNLRRLEENLNYSAEGLARTWRRFSVTNERGGAPNDRAYALARKPVAIANEVYSNRMGNGPPESGDGWAYRGRGPLQITGKDMYDRASRSIGYNVLLHPDLLLEPMVGSLSSAWLFMVEKNCAIPAMAGDVVTCTRRINGGDVGLLDRQDRYALAEQVLA